MDGSIHPRDPAEVAYFALLEGLRKASVAYRAASGPEDRVWAAAIAVSAITRFLEHDPTIRRECLTDPLFALATACCTLADGGRPDLFKVPAASNRPTDRNRDFEKAAAMSALDAALEGGLSLSEAAREVAKEMRRCGCKIQSPEVLGWRDNFGRATPFARECRTDLRSRMLPADVRLTRETALAKARWIIRRQFGVPATT